MNAKKIVLILVSTLIFLCSAAAQSRKYKPVSDWEKSYYEKADKSVSPEDVKKNPSENEKKLCVWVGIAKQFHFDDSNEKYDILWMRVEHHFYDWIEDLALPAPINLSSTSEGMFTTYMLLKKGFDYTKLASEGDCIIVYGYPSYLPEDDEMRITGEYLRPIKAQYVNSSWLPYE